jgi:amino acid transporter
VHYLAVLFPFSTPVLTVALVAGFTAIATLGVRESVGLAAAMGVVEIAGLLVAIAAGLLAAPEFHMAGMFPMDLAGWRGAFAGAFIAFFAFIGFETLANLAEEVKDPKQTVPRGIVGAVGASIVLYVAVAAAAVLADSTASSPLLDLFEGTNASVFAAVGGIAVANGVLVEIVMLARLFYGMARNNELPAVLGRINPRTRTPTIATVLAGTIVLAAALLVPFERLLVLTNALTLGVFALIDLALWRVQSREPATVETFMLPHWVPPLAALLAMGLMLAEVLV